MSETATGPEEPHDQQQQNGADRGIDDLADNAGTERDAKFGKEKTGDQCAGDADENIADDSKAGAAHDLAGQPARHQADEQNDQNAFIGYLHKTPSLGAAFLRAAFERAYPYSPGVTTPICDVLRTRSGLPPRGGSRTYPY